MNAGDSYFVDTSVLLYAVDGRDMRKQKAAAEWLDRLWRDGTGRISWQILNEYYVNATRKMDIPPAAARQTVEALAYWRPAECHVGLLQAAWHWMDRASLSYWDALVVAAAQHTGCRWLLSEDLQAGQSFGELTVLDPFTTPPKF